MSRSNKKRRNQLNIVYPKVVIEVAVKITKKTCRYKKYKNINKNM